MTSYSSFPMLLSSFFFAWIPQTHKPYRPHAKYVTRLENEDGAVTPLLKERVLRITKGGVGYFILGAAGVMDKRSGPLLRICDDRFIPGLAELVKEVRGETDAKIGLQLVHFLKLAKTGYRQKVDDLVSEEIQEIIEAMVQAAVRVRKAGFDAVEWDAESGMTLSSFLSLLNKGEMGMVEIWRTA